MSGSKRSAKIEISAQDQTRKGLADARRSLRTFEREQRAASRAAERDEKKRARDVQRTRDRQMKQVGGMGRGVIGGVATAAGFDIAGGIGGMTSEIMDTHKEMTRFQIDAQLSSAEAARFYEELGHVSDASGQSRNALVHAAHAYQILTGDAKGAIESVQLFAEVANASGASMDEIGAAAAAMNKNMKMDPKQFREGFDVILSMGHKGAIELRDVAAEIPSIAPQFAQFGAGGGVKGLTEMMAALQVVRHGFGSASEAATGLASLMTGIVKKRKKLEAAGIKVVNKDGSLRDFMDIVDQMKKKKVDMMMLMDELGRTEGVRAALQLTGEANSEMHELYRTALGSNQVAKDNATYMSSASGKIAVAWETIKNTIGEALSPERVQAFADALQKAASVWKGIENVGKSLRGWWSGNGKESASIPDLMKIKLLERKKAEGEQLAPDEQRQLKFAKSRVGDVQGWNQSIDAIMEGENGTEHATPESLRAALYAKYNDRSYSDGHAGAARVGEKYMGAAGFQDPIALVNRLSAQFQASSQKQIVDAIKNGFAGIVLKMNGEKVGKAVDNARPLTGHHR